MKRRNKTYNNVYFDEFAFKLFTKTSGTEVWWHPKTILNWISDSFIIVILTTTAFYSLIYVIDLLIKLIKILNV